MIPVQERHDKKPICRGGFLPGNLHQNMTQMAKQFFNMIASEEGTACILLYGDIGSGTDEIRSSDIVREFLELTALYKKVDIRINSMGGDVFAGLAIFNALRNSGSDITLYIDGVAASIASVIASCGKPVYASRYARLVVHSVSGGCYGNKEDHKRCINELESLEETLADIYSAKSGKDREEIKNSFFDGKDHWFTAEEALKEGLIDGIYDTEPVEEASSPEEIYHVFQNRLKPNPNTMFTDELRKRPSFANLASDEEMLRHIGHLETEAGRVSGLTAQITELQSSLQTYKDKEEKEAEAKRNALVDAAVKDGRIRENQRKMYQDLLVSDPENAEAVLKSLKPSRRVLDDIQTTQEGETSAWENRMKQIKDNLKS